MNGYISSYFICEARSVQPRETNWELFCDDFCLENGATAIGTVPVIGHGPTYGWVNSEKSVSAGHNKSDQKHYEF